MSSVIVYYKGKNLCLFISPTTDVHVAGSTVNPDVTDNIHGADTSPAVPRLPVLPPVHQQQQYFHRAGISAVILYSV